jgi:poly-gamma-glutamate capsule biosynthesis protein CapA/YwtB (metallophosphatase superfamily)
LLLTMFLTIVGCSAPQPQPETEPGEVVEAKPAQPTEPDKRSLRISVAGVGDIMLGTDFPKNILPDDDGVSFLNEVTPVLSSVDVAFGNLEGVLMDGGEPVKECKNPDACYLFRSPTRYANYLRDAGFDVMSLANNHARDFGEAGRDASAAALDAVGIRHSGRHGTAASWEQNELRIAMIAFSPTRGSWNLLDIDLAAWAVAGLARSHDIIIVSFHGGAEGFEGAERIGFGMEEAYGEQRGDVVAFSRAVIDAGADIVFGHGPHVPRAMEVYKDRLIAYSLGNFANYYGISVRGARGYAPIVEATLDGDGRFIAGRIHSFIQVRPGGPRPDSRQRALRMISELTSLDFPAGQLDISPSGELSIKR